MNTASNYLCSLYPSWFLPEQLEMVFSVLNKVTKLDPAVESSVSGAEAVNVTLVASYECMAGIKNKMSPQTMTSMMSTSFGHVVYHFNQFKAIVPLYCLGSHSISRETRFKH